jgi:negative regulator of flagellin synthesis FlgM
VPDVTNKISGYQNRPVQVGTEKSVSRPRGPAPGATETSASSSGASPVQITDRARQLAALERAVAAQPIVNEARVAEIRLAIEEGGYEVAPERIADKLIQMERELKSAEK